MADYQNLFQCPYCNQYVPIDVEICPVCNKNFTEENKHKMTLGQKLYLTFALIWAFNINNFPDVKYIGELLLSLLPFILWYIHYLKQIEAEHKASKDLIELGKKYINQQEYKEF